MNILCANVCLSSGINIPWVSENRYLGILYELEACPLVKSELSSLDFVVNIFFMKMFRTNTVDIVRDMQFLFWF